jgi:hypothetical protein
MRFKLWKKYAFLIAHVRAEELAETAQPRLRLKRTRSRSQYSQFGMIGKNARHRICVELLPGKFYQPFLLDEVRGHVATPVLFHAGNGLQPDGTVIRSSRAPGVAPHY